jgi:hypothetical protein
MTHYPSQNGKALLWILLVAAVAAGLVYYFYFLDRQDTMAEPSKLPPRVVIEEEAEPQPDVISHDSSDSKSDWVVEEEEEPSEPLPPLVESDDAALAAAAELVGEEPAMKYIVAESLISRLVASVNALTLEQLPRNIVPLNAPGGKLQATPNGLSDEVNPETGLRETLYVLDASNFQRYTAQVEVFEAMDPGALVDRYRMYYPLLQESYRELGYPEGDFNDRLLEVIDHLLATPEPAAPIRLVKPEAVFEFEDPELEALSAGQKFLIRIGPSNAQRVKVKLAQIREAIQTQLE